MVSCLPIFTFSSLHSGRRNCRNPSLGQAISVLNWPRKGVCNVLDGHRQCSCNFRKCQQCPCVCGEGGGVPEGSRPRTLRVLLLRVLLRSHWNQPEAKLRTGSAWFMCVFLIYTHPCFLQMLLQAICDVYMRHPSLSKQHAVFQYRGRSFADPKLPHAPPTMEVLPYIMDLGSTNGTFLNGERIEAQRYNCALLRTLPLLRLHFQFLPRNAAQNKSVASFFFSLSLSFILYTLLSFNFLSSMHMLYMHIPFSFTYLYCASALCSYYELREKDSVRFAESSRDYVLLSDTATNKEAPM